MRITEQAKKENRARIIKAANELFTQKGFEETTTRDIARASGLAVGTMFNYFPSKETLAMTMVKDALTRGGVDYLKRRTDQDGLSEELFLFITTGLHRLKPMHRFIGPVLEKSLSPFARKTVCLEGEAARIEHLAIVRQILASHGHNMTPDLVVDNLYWSLYLGILAFWSNDRSPGQVATLALIDYMLTLFIMMVKSGDGTCRLEKGDVK